MSDLRKALANISFADLERASTATTRRTDSFHSRGRSLEALFRITHCVAKIARIHEDSKKLFKELPVALATPCSVPRPYSNRQIQTQGRLPKRYGVCQQPH